jgi:sacsin
VYNWTDNPSILSGSSLLLLDPHEGWSASPEVAHPGGPLFDFVEHSQEPAMKGQLSAFGSITTAFDTEFHGTIIRLPLRTEEQAIRSKIVANHMFTKEDEIMEIFDKFAGELVDSLLFLRNIRSITLRVDDDVFAKAESTIIGGGDVQGEFCINQGYREVFVEQSKELCEADFMTEISFYRRPEKPGMAATNTKIKFAVSHHLRKACQDDRLQKWARSQKLFPWIAIASPLDVCPSRSYRLTCC